MARSRKNLKFKNSGRHHPVQIIIDPKSCNLDKAVRDVLNISETVSEQIPSARLRSIELSDYFAVVKASVPKEFGAKEVTLRLYEIHDAWKIRGSAFTDKEANHFKKQALPKVTFQVSKS